MNCLMKNFGELEEKEIGIGCFGGGSGKGVKDGGLGLDVEGGSVEGGWMSGGLDMFMGEGNKD